VIESPLEQPSRWQQVLDEILETMDILADAEMVTAIAESEEAIERGDTRTFKDFITELVS